MRQIIRIAQTETKEHLRQPWMLFILGANYALWIAVFGTLFAFLNAASGNKEMLAQIQLQLKAFGVELDTMLKMATSTFSSLSFTNLPLYVAIMSGTSVLHDRECGTMPFLMLAPVTRRKLLFGKLIGATAIPLVLHILLVGTSSLLLSRFDLLTPFSSKLGASTAWWVAFLLGTPASAAFVGALGTVISARSQDMRTAMQYTNFFIGLLSLGFSFVLVQGISEGPLFQIVYAFGCLIAAALTLLIGARLISQDI